MQAGITDFIFLTMALQVDVREQWFSHYFRKINVKKEEKKDLP